MAFLVCSTFLRLTNKIELQFRVNCGVPQYCTLRRILAFYSHIPKLQQTYHHVWCSPPDRVSMFPIVSRDFYIVSGCEPTQPHTMKHLLLVVAHFAYQRFKDLVYGNSLSIMYGPIHHSSAK